MSLAQRIRDFRYSKGWGPDELANRAEISRTALYQIESGKTELPRAGTLRRIAVALDVPMEELLGHGLEPETVSKAAEPQSTLRPSPPRFGWPAEDTSIRNMAAGTLTSLGAPKVDNLRHPADAAVKTRALAPEAPFLREGELMSKLHDLLHSPFGDCITSIVDDLHRVLKQAPRAI